MTDIRLSIASNDTTLENSEVLESPIDIPNSPRSSTRLSDDPNANQLRKRRVYERRLILKYDSDKISREDIWFIIDSEWMNMWISFVSEDGPIPGPLVYGSLYDNNKKFKKDLKAKIDYRGVNPLTYAIFYEIYGTKEAPPIARWGLDIYGSPVEADDFTKILRGPSLKARVLITDMKYNIEGWPSHVDDESILYRCCCRCHTLAFILDSIFGGPAEANTRNQNYEPVSSVEEK